ncbi:MAG: DUF4148 domain-containing protein [Pseudomonadota bacterium]
MNIKHIVASVSLILAAGVALAEPGQSNLQDLKPAAGGLTREQVKADVLRARAAGELEFNDYTYPVIASEPSGLTREQVKAEVLRARAAGELDFNDYEYPVIVSAPSGKTREQVRAEVIAARAAGELEANEVAYPSFFEPRALRANVNAVLHAKAKTGVDSSGQ